MKSRVIVLDSSETLLEMARPILERAGYEVGRARSVADVIRRARDGAALVVLDACEPRPGGPPETISELRKRTSAPVLQVSGCLTVDAASRSHPIRADGFLVRPFRPAEFVAAVDRLSEGTGPGDFDFHGMYAGSPCMREVFRAVRLVAPTGSTVLITGETGTGKEMLARAVHAESAVADGPFVPVDCGALPGSLLESELFGHVKGAFTGAVEEKPGLIEAAHGGTLFLDEVGNMPPRLQMLLLRVLQEGEVRQVGGRRFRQVRMRIVAATSRDLSHEVRAGRFREDLYYRLRVFTIELPPLRERHEDVERIVRGHLAPVPGERGPASITPGALELLEAHRWPGNVRELLGVLEGARIRAKGAPIGIGHLPPEVLRVIRLHDPADAGGSHPPPARSRFTETQRIALALEETGGNRSRAAEILGVSRTTLWRRMRELGIDAPPA